MGGAQTSKDRPRATVHEECLAVAGTQWVDSPVLCKSAELTYCYYVIYCTRLTKKACLFLNFVV